MNPWRALTLTGYFGTFAVLVLWYSWLAPSQQLPIPLTLLVAVPLLFPLKGLLQGKLYTYRWSLFLALGYVAHGTMETFALPEERTYGLLETFFAAVWFLAGIVYVRSRRGEATAQDSGER